MIDSDLTANVVFGTTAHGGAVYSSPLSGTLLIMIRTRVVKNSALSMGVNGESFGGGIFNGGAMRQVDSHVLENVASIASPAERASAGGIYNADGARAILDGCLLHSNTAGGAGLFQVTSFPYDDGSRAAYEASKAAHILTYGRMELMATTVVEGSSFVPIGYEAQKMDRCGGRDVVPPLEQLQRVVRICCDRFGNWSFVIGESYAGSRDSGSTMHS